MLLCEEDERERKCIWVPVCDVMFNILCNNEKWQNECKRVVLYHLLYFVCGNRYTYYHLCKKKKKEHWKIIIFGVSTWLNLFVFLECVFSITYWPDCWLSLLLLQQIQLLLYPQLLHYRVHTLQLNTYYKKNLWIVKCKVI